MEEVPKKHADTLKERIIKVMEKETGGLMQEVMAKCMEEMAVYVGEYLDDLDNIADFVETVRCNYCGKVIIKREVLENEDKIIDHIINCKIMEVREDGEGYIDYILVKCNICSIENEVL